MRIRANSVLKNLTEQQLEQIYDSIASGDTYRAVQKRCAQEPPEGFGLFIQLKTLCHFFKAERRRRHAEELAEAKFDELDDENPDQLLQNVKVELAHACFDLANHSDTPNLNVLSRITHRLDAIKVDQLRVAVEQQRLVIEQEFLAEKKRQFNYNAAREAAKHAVKIHKIIEAPTPDAEDKTWMVSEIVFGPPPQSALISAPLNSKTTNQ